MKQLLKQFWQEESGATLVEYAILVALISVAAIAVIATLGDQIQAAFQDVSDQLADEGITGGGGGGGGTN